MSLRLKFFRNCETHAWFNKLYKKLNSNEISLCESFINEHDALNNGDFELKLNRMFLDKEKPKNWKIITELLCCANSSLKQ